MKTIYEGNYTTLHKQGNIDVFYDIISVMMRAFSCELGEKNELQFIACPNSKEFGVLANKDVVFAASMISNYYKA